MTISPLRRSAPLKPLRPLSKPIFWTAFSASTRELYRKSQADFGYSQADRQIASLLAKASCFDFIGQVAVGRTLFIGEGNLSFALNLAKNARINPRRVTASTYEPLSDLTVETRRNAGTLRELGAIVMHNTDGTNLGHILGSLKFDNIVFQFPHTGSREPLEGRNPNYILLLDFLKSARRHLNYAGKVLVTTVDSPHYEGAFQFEEAASKAGFSIVQKFDFDLSKFSGYHHTMTNQDDSALENHSRFVTRLFKVKL